MIRAATFDAAGTLIAPREPVGRTYARVARGLGVPAEEADVEDAFRRAFASAPALAFPDAGVERRDARERAWWRDIVRAALALDAADPRLGACADALFAHYARAAAWTVFPDVAPALQDLRSRGVRMGVVSNFDGRLPGLLDQLGLARAFDAVVSSSEAGAAKPAPAIFATAARRLGVALPELCHVGDDLEADVAGAASAGAMGVHLDRRGTRPASIGALTELPARLAAAQA